MRECIDCKWFDIITNSQGEYVHICVDTESGAYLQETGYCGNCNLEPIKDDDKNNCKESSIQKQRRFNCYVSAGVSNWDCYKDCAFWNGECCSKYEEDEED